jgi:ubiquinone/menaquinone biosynthesis C-methylase UbiE
MSPSLCVDYDRIAPTYNQRYVENERSDTAEALLACTDQIAAERGYAPRVLEVGCGTGRWLAELRAVTPHVVGLDLSAGMLAQARKLGRESLRKLAGPPAGLARGRAEQLPFPEARFDLVYCVNAIHHFDQPRAFISEARRLLRPGSALAVVGMDPRGRRQSWYVYRYFDGVYETDLRRFPSWAEIADWMSAEGLAVECRVVERIFDPKRGREVLDDPFLRKTSCSQLALLSQGAYRAGLRRIHDALDRAEAAGETLTFPVDTPLAMISGRLEE